MTVVNLNAFDLIAVSGVDAKKFLQGQVTCNVDLLSPDHSLEGAICNLKGRVICDFRLIEHDHVCYLSMEPGMAAIVIPILNKYIVFSRATCEQIGNGVRRSGLIADDGVPGAVSPAIDWPTADGNVISWGDLLIIRIRGTLPRYELWQFSASSASQARKLMAGMAAVDDSKAWVLEDIRSGIAHVTPALTERHLPEALNYDLSGVINFKKGCYTGQEIVARMYYRGTAKKRTFHAVADRDCGQPQSISCRHGFEGKSEEGELLALSPDTEGQWHCLAILPTTAVEETSQVYLNGNVKCPVTILGNPATNQPVEPVHLEEGSGT